jgi:hypothetical protein
MWRNGPGGRWSARITWFGEGDNRQANIRLELEDCERSINLYPDTKEKADHIWQMFRQGAPQDGQKVPFITELLELLARIDENLEQEK